MKLTEFSELERLDFDISDLNARVQTWHEGDVYDYSLKKRFRSGLMYIHDCEAEYEWDGGRLQARRGSLVFLPQGMNYRVRFSSVGSGECTLLANFILSVEPARVIEMLSANAGKIAADFRELAALYLKPTTSPLCFKSRMYSLLWHAVSLYNNEEKTRSGGIGMLLRHIGESPDISEPELAALCGMSVPTLIRTVKLYTGMTPKQYILSIRLEKAKKLLSDGIFTAGEIASLLGFSSPSHFGAAFRRGTGMSPGEYLRGETDKKTGG